MTSDSSELRIPDHSTDENLTMRRLPALLLLLIATLPALAQVQWRSGALLYTPAYDFTLGYTPNGTGYFVSQAYIPSPPQPTVNQPFYVSLRMEGIASPAVGRLMVTGFIPPAGVSVVVDASTPVRCFYRAMSGIGSWTEFTNTVLTDVSFGANLRITGCPQPATAANPYSVISIPGGSAYHLDRRDTGNPGATSWPLGSQAGYEFLIPLVSDRTISGNSGIESERFYGTIQSIQGDGLDPWVYPNLGLLVSASSPTPTTDLQVSQQLPPPPPPAGKVGYSIRCTNNGPNAASNVSCGFVDVPTGLNASVICSPTSPQASLAAGSAIVCSVILDKYLGIRTMSGVVSSGVTPDSNLANNTFPFSLYGGIAEVILQSGFETLGP
ncbi:MAG: hypothetical protein IPF83_04100 [Rhodanobacteraceae bacterium]|nr:hypothetical protein [Rhodanobacteraceae bacterium]MBP9154162.1 hypothetical protein [Xanthomonadales bacterium]HQW81585.1 hypothetical protein [Pseudomonadota bacterium]